jgi:hypothetical protein
MQKTKKEQALIRKAMRAAGIKGIPSWEMRAFFPYQSRGKRNLDEVCTKLFANDVLTCLKLK